MEEHIKKGLTNLNEDWSHSENSKRAPNGSPELFLYTNIFPDHGLPTYINVPLSWGIPLTAFDFIEFELGFKMVWESLDMDYKVGTRPFTKTANFVDENGYMFQVSCTWGSETSNDVRTKRLIESIKSMGLKDTARHVEQKHKKKDSKSYLYIDSIEFFAPAPPFRDNDYMYNILDKLVPYIQARDVSDEFDNTGKIHMLVKEDYDMYFKDFDVSKFTPELQSPDIFYGIGFDKFNEDLITRLEKEKKGVVLFHGHPGTGKTHYIRFLLRELAKIDKRVIYIPPSLVEAMTDPSLVSFLTNNIIEEERDTILLIEDAEPLLESREEQGGIRTTGISNLLNSTDGLLNDILGLVVMATFNTDLKNIDKALLRPGRLLARKEFKKILAESVLDAAKVLNVPTDKIEEGKDYSVAELLDFKDGHSVLLHEHEEKKYRPIGFGN